MTLPSFILGTLIAMTIGCGFHFWRGGGLKWLVLFNLFSIMGFWLGHFVASIFHIKFFLLGPMYLGAAIILSVIFLFVGYWLSMASVETDAKKLKK